VAVVALEKGAVIGFQEREFCWALHVSQEKVWTAGPGTVVSPEYRSRVKAKVKS
jgi:hypothetical protein